MIRDPIAAAAQVVLFPPGDPEIPTGTVSPEDIARLASFHTQYQRALQLFERGYLPGWEEENSLLWIENARLQQRLEQLEARISDVESVIPTAKVVVLREIPREQVKREIASLFASGETLDYEDIVDKLRLDLELVVDICNELIAEGVIGPDDGTDRPR